MTDQHAGDNVDQDLMDVDTDFDLVGSDEDLAVIGRDDVSNYNEDHILPQPPKIIARIRRWLQPTDYNLGSGEFRKHLGTHQPGTCQWLLATPNYRAWHDGKRHGLLWINGIPGSGKSVFAASLVDTLSREGHIVLFFFFRQIIDANHKPVNLLRDWLDQMLEYSPPLQQDLEPYSDVFSSSKRTLESVGMPELWAHLKSALSRVTGQVCLVADALDEMDKDNDEFLQDLAKLGSWRPAKVKVIITSRPVPAVQEPLRGIPALHIRLDESLVDVDIATYVQMGLERSSIAPQDQELIRRAVPGRANGLFLYAKLAMEAFTEPGANVHRILDALPRDLNAMYRNLLQEHARRSGVPEHVQLLILSWATHAIRPLRLLEMAEMISVTCDNVTLDDGLRSARALVRAACGPLLEILPDDTVSVVHHSFTEFLRGSTRSMDSHAFPILTLGPTHDELALSCLRYLQSGCLGSIQLVAPKSGGTTAAQSRLQSDRPPQLDARLRFPFLGYAAENWLKHAARAAETGFVSPALSDAFDCFFASESRFKAWLDTTRLLPGREGVNALHVAARFGLVWYTNLLLRRGSIPIDCADGNPGWTPLAHAALMGHASVVQMLINAGADPNPLDGHRQGPLHRAANANEVAVITVLLESGVSGFKEFLDYDQRDPFMTACAAGHVEAVDTFLSFSGDAGMATNALCQASLAGHSTLVKHLLQRWKVDVNAVVDGGTALYFASYAGDVDAMEALMAAGADVSILFQGGSSVYMREAATLNFNSMLAGTSALEAFCSSTKSVDPDIAKQGLDILLAAGVDVNRRSSSGRTPLFFVSGHPVVVRLLLDAGADATASMDDGRTLLHYFKRGRSIDHFRVFVEEGKADINSRAGKDGLTPLMAKMKKLKDKSWVEFLQEFRPDCNLADSKGNTPMHMAASGRAVESRCIFALDTLVAAGGKLDCRNHAGDMPIHVARYPMVAAHLARAWGADLEARDGDGATALMRNLRDVDSCEALVKLGAKLDVRDFSGRTLLHELIGHFRRRPYTQAFDPDMVQPLLEYLVGSGLDPKAVDNLGNSLFHELPDSGIVGYDKQLGQVFRKLLSYGVDPTAVNHAGQTFLHAVCEKEASRGGWPDVDGMLLKKAIEVCDVNAADRDGIRPIHLAASRGERRMVLLMDAGADFSAPTLEGLTPLHLAAQGRQSNVVGLLLGALGDERRGKGNEAISAAIDAVDLLNRTPLYYACRSGRPEAVVLLVNAGADVRRQSVQLLEACSEFEKEDMLWGMALAKDSNPRQRARAGLSGKLDDNGRPGHKSPPHADHRYLTSSDTARLNEILDVLMEHGFWVPPDLVLAKLRDATQSGFHYTAGCLRKLIPPAGPLEIFDSPKAPRDVALVAGETTNMNDQLRSLLVRREFSSVKAAFSRASCDPCLPNSSGETALGVLIRLGYGSLLESVATKEHIMKLDDRDWRVRQGAQCNEEEGYVSLYPPALSACSCDLPNMAVLRLVIQRFGASTNEGRLEDRKDNGRGVEYKFTTTPLHELSRGKCWWHVYEAIPYLLSHKADVDIGDWVGRTPLFSAIDHNGPYALAAAKMLIEAGADINARSEDGSWRHTCLELAAFSGDMEKVRFLVDHGALIWASTLYNAVNSSSFEILSFLLSREKSLKLHVAQRLTYRGGLATDQDTGVWVYEVSEADDDEAALQRCCSSLLRYATGHYPQKGNKRVRAKTIQILLEHGANPFAEFWNPETYKPFSDLGDRNDGGCEPRSMELPTILHHVVETCGVVEPFLELPGLDLERRDVQGRTVLLAACSNCRAFTQRIRMGEECPRNDDEQDQAGEDGEFLITLLLQRGADARAVDASDQNALQLLFGSCFAASYSYTCPSIPVQMPVPLRSLLATAPELVDQVSVGPTALHMYLVSCVARCHTWGIHDPKPEVTEVIDLLLDAGTDPRRADEKGETLLHVLAKGLLVSTLIQELFKRFLSLGLDVNARDRQGRTPVFELFGKDVLEFAHTGPDVAIWKKNLEAATNAAFGVFVDAGAEFGVKDFEGQGLLHAAAEGTSPQRAQRFQKLMKEHGLDPMALDHQLRSSLDIAAGWRNKKVLELFEREKTAVGPVVG